jgi:membrane-associated phospholipid phosphatase
MARADHVAEALGVDPAFLSHDETVLDRFDASFHKLLEHDNQGRLTERGARDYAALVRGLYRLARGEAATDLLNGLTVQGPEPKRLLINPRAGAAARRPYGEDFAATDVAAVLSEQLTSESLKRQLSLASAQTAAEMVEVYGMTMLRDATLGDYARADYAQLIVDTLNSFGRDFVWTYDADGAPVTAADTPVTVDNLFRGPTRGDLEGDYLSAFVTRGRAPLFPSGCAPAVADRINATQFAEPLSEPLTTVAGDDGRDFARSLDAYTAIQNGEIPAVDGVEGYPPGYFDARVPIRTGRHLGDYVHIDNAYEEYVRAADMLAATLVRRTPGSPYVAGRYRNEGDGPTLGPADVWALLGVVRAEAERAAFAQKWLFARRARPETMAWMIDLARREQDPVEAFRDFLHPSLFDERTRVFFETYRAWNRARNGSDGWLLPQMYPEGSPAHPAWPSGHATIAGACTTAIKALYDGAAEFQPPGADARRFNVTDELDKLASNVALGRNFGGVHYRTDGEHGLLLGEAVAIRVLRRELTKYAEDGVELRLRKRSGRTVTLAAEQAPTTGA